MTLELHWDETPEEKSKRIDEILKRNSEGPSVCVACLELISDRETAISTPYGLYHGPPFTCEEDGRDDKDIPWYQK